MPDAKPMQYRIVDRFSGDHEGERERVIAALLAPAASIAPKYFYDELGCALYAAICLLDRLIMASLVPSAVGVMAPAGTPESVIPML